MRLPIILLALSSAAAQTPSYDVIIAGGRVVDGAGGPWYMADVGLRGDTIAAVGRLRDQAAKLRIEAQGLVIAPGFIDIHSHAGRGIQEVPTAEAHIRQGVTLLIEGNDGGSPIPLRPALEKLAALRPGINFGYFIGQGTIRSRVMGTVNRRATAEEIEKMREIARQGMLDGAFGLSTGLFYVPGNYTPTEEVIEIAKEVGKLGGMHISHMREEAAHVADSVRETIRIGEEGGLPTQVTHHKIIGKANWGKSAETLRLIEEARARGVDVTVDQYPYTASHTGSAAMFPQWSLEGGGLLKRLEDPELRAKIKIEIERRIRDDRGGGDPRNVQFARCPDASLNGRTLADAIAARGLEVTLANAAETVIDIQKAGGCSCIYHAISEPDVERILSFPWTMVASDGELPVFGKASPHPRAYGTFARVLGRYVREKGTIRLEDAIRKMSSFPAARLKLFDRGLLRPGMKADVVVLDPARVADRSEFTKPHRYSEGVRDVFINGVAVLRDGTTTGARPGRVLLGPAAISPLPRAVR
jgi:dihydroorotase/N-acyl-D-amino-acid deacylase